MKFSGKLRAGIFFSGLWVFLSFLIANIENEFSTMAFLIIGIFPLALIWGSVWVIKGFTDNKQPTNKKNSDKDCPSDTVSPTFSTSKMEEINIDGWLILPALGVLFVPFLNLLELFNDYRIWANIASPNVLQIELISFGVLSDLIIFILSIVVFFKFFGKEKNAPLYIIIYYIVNIFISGLVVLNLYDIAFAFPTDILKISEDQAFNSLIRNCIVGFIWIPYFFLSKRVKLTFVN